MEIHNFLKSAYLLSYIYLSNNFWIDMFMEINVLFWFHYKNWTCIEGHNNKDDFCPRDYWIVSIVWQVDITLRLSSGSCFPGSFGLDFVKSSCIFIAVTLMLFYARIILNSLDMTIHATDVNSHHLQSYEVMTDDELCF